jgi:Family of unknown function (DUF5335)
MTTTREVAREIWSRYFDSLSDELLNHAISIEIVESPNRTVVQAKGLALQLLTYDRRDDVFEVTAAQGSPTVPRVLRHLVDHPTRIEIDSPALSLVPTTIAVTGGDGVRTVVRIWHEGAFTG